MEYKTTLSSDINQLYIASVYFLLKSSDRYDLNLSNKALGLEGEHCVRIVQYNLRKVFGMAQIIASSMQSMWFWSSWHRPKAIAAA